MIKSSTSVSTSRSPIGGMKPSKHGLGAAIVTDRAINNRSHAFSYVVK